jgi:hypothetical protein
MTIENIEQESYDLSTLRQMCQDMGWEWCENESSYQAYYGKNKCDHVIRIPGAKYTIGVVKVDGKNKLVWDSFGSGGLSRILGSDAKVLKQAYQVAKIKVTAKKAGKRFWMKDTDKVGWKRIRIEA